VNVDAGMFFQPGAHRGMLVRSVVVDDEMQRERRGRLAMKFFEKGEPLDVRVLRRRRCPLSREPERVPTARAATDRRGFAHAPQSGNFARRTTSESSIV
jgi:hypothetical protein